PAAANTASTFATLAYALSADTSCTVKWQTRRVGAVTRQHRGGRYEVGLHAADHVSLDPIVPGAATALVLVAAAHPATAGAPRRSDGEARRHGCQRQTALPPQLP